MRYIDRLNELVSHHTREVERLKAGAAAEQLHSAEFHDQAAAPLRSLALQLQAKSMQENSGWDDDEGHWETASRHDAAWFWGSVTAGVVLLAGSVYVCYRWLI